MSSVSLPAVSTVLPETLQQVWREAAEAPEALLRGAGRAQARLHVLHRLWDEGRLSRARVLLGVLLEPRRLYWVRLRRWRNESLEGEIATGHKEDRRRPVGAPVWLRENEVADWVVIHEDGGREGEFVWRELKRRAERLNRSGAGGGTL